MHVKLPPWAQAFAVVLALIVASVSLTVSIVDTDDDGSPDRIDFVVNTVPGDGAKAVELSVPEPLADQAARNTESDLVDAGEPLTDVQDVVPGQVAAAEQAEQQVRDTADPLPTAGASGGFDGCVTRFVSNQSSRNGVRPNTQTLHYTVSSNRPGWDDVNAIVNYFNGSSGASSHFVLDAEGHCAYIVPIERKSWTQVAANPFAISYEIIARGDEQVYLEPAGYAKLASVMRQVSQRTGIPMRRGAVNGCVTTRSGIVQHADYGICGGGHHDINPFSIDDVVKVVTSTAAAASSPTAKLTKPERKIAGRRCLHRRKVIAAPNRSARKRAQLRYSNYWQAQAAERKRRLTALKHQSDRPWKFRSRGTRRLLMAKTERFAKRDRRILCA